MVHEPVRKNIVRSNARSVEGEIVAEKEVPVPSHCPAACLSPYSIALMRRAHGLAQAAGCICRLRAPCPLPPAAYHASVCPDVCCLRPAVGCRSTLGAGRPTSSSTLCDNLTSTFSPFSRPTHLRRALLTSSP